MNSLFFLSLFDILTGCLHGDVRQVQQKGGNVRGTSTKSVCEPSDLQEHWWCGCTQERNEAKKRTKANSLCTDGIHNHFKVVSTPTCMVVMSQLEKLPLEHDIIALQHAAFPKDTRDSEKSLVRRLETPHRGESCPSAPTGGCRSMKSQKYRWNTRSADFQSIIL